MYAYSTLSPSEQISGPEGCNYAVATGSRSGVWVLDFDTLDAYQRLADSFPPTYTVATGRGVHLYFRCPEWLVKNSAGELGAGIDVRGEGGYVVAAGSLHKSGRTYDLMEDVEPADAPAWLLEWPGLRGAVNRRDPGNNAPVLEPLPREHPEYESRLTQFVEYCKTSEPAIEGQNGSGKMWRVALEGAVLQRLQRNDVKAAIIKHYNPRCEPTWTEEEIDHKLDGVSTGNVAAYRQGAQVLEPWAESLESKPQHAHVLNKLRQLQDRPEDPIKEPAPKPVTLSFNALLNVFHRHGAWSEVFRFDVLSRRTVAVSPPIALPRMEAGAMPGGEIGRIQNWLSNIPSDGQGEEDVAVGINASREMVEHVVETLATCHPFNPFADYLDSLPRPNAIQELDRVHETILHSPAGAVASSVFKKQMVAAVRRARAAGQPRRVDHQVVMVLVGEQNIGKGRFLRLLGGDWYASLTGDIRNKDTALKLQGKVIVELEEMSTARRADRDALKAFLSTADDLERAPYERTAECVPRSYVFFGSSNDPELTDPTGNRRFAMIPINRVDIDYAEKVRHLLWAEADLLASTDFDHHLTRDEASTVRELARPHEDIDPWIDSVRGYLKGKKWIKGAEEIFRNVVAKGDSGAALLKFDRAAQRRIHDCLRYLGCKKDAHKPEERGTKGWGVPEELADQSAPHSSLGAKVVQLRN